MRTFFFCCVFFLSSPVFGQESFRAFTGRISGDRVRVRVGADLNSYVVREVNKDDVLLVVGEEKEFWAVAPAKDLRCYVYRTYLLDGTVEASRVNVRLKPALDAPILAVLQMGEKVFGEIDADHPKWYAISPPHQVQFYVNKQYLGFLGDAEAFSEIHAKKQRAESDLFSAYAELEKALNGSQNVAENETLSRELLPFFQQFVEQHAEFPCLQEKAREGIAILKKRFSLMEVLVSASTPENPVPVKTPALPAKPNLIAKNSLEKTSPRFFPSVQGWDAVEEHLFSHWKKEHDDAGMQQYYEQQKLDAEWIEGFIEKYHADLCNKPGDFVLKKNHQPVAFLYSTAVDLSTSEGKSVQVLVAPRPNHHFAFPAYYVLEMR